jgi:hypothetical protein
MKLDDILCMGYLMALTVLGVLLIIKFGDWR